MIDEIKHDIRLYEKRDNDLTYVDAITLVFVFQF